MKEKLKNSLTLFLVFLKIGLFTFGGGYAMVSLIQDEIVAKRKWLSQNDMFEIIILSESTPGPIAVNMATFCGYRVAGVLGSTFATIGLAIPSYVIITIISYFFNDFLKYPIFNAAFKGLKIGVMVLLLTTIVKLSKEIEKNAYFYIFATLSLGIMLTFTILVPNFSWISLILIVSGLFCGTVNQIILVKKEKKNIIKEDKK